MSENSICQMFKLLELRQYAVPLSVIFMFTVASLSFTNSVQLTLAFGLAIVLLYFWPKCTGRRLQYKVCPLAVFKLLDLNLDRGIVSGELRLMVYYGSLEQPPKEDVNEYFERDFENVVNLPHKLTWFYPTQSLQSSQGIMQTSTITMKQSIGICDIAVEEMARINDSSTVVKEDFLELCCNAHGEYQLTVTVMPLVIKATPGKKTFLGKISYHTQEGITLQESSITIPVSIGSLSTGIPITNGNQNNFSQLMSAFQNITSSVPAINTNWSHSTRHGWQLPPQYEDKITRSNGKHRTLLVQISQECYDDAKRALTILLERPPAFGTSITRERISDTFLDGLFDWCEGCNPRVTHLYETLKIVGVGEGKLKPIFENCFPKNPSTSSSTLAG